MSLTSKMNLERIDREIQAIGESQLVVMPPRDYWGNIETSLSAIYGETNIKELIMQVVGGGGRTLYSTSNWPDQGISI